MVATPTSTRRGATTVTASEADAPLTPQELADRMVPADPRISPDGRRVLFTAAPVGKKGETPEQAVWIAEPGSAPRKLTAGTAEDTAPRWSPDGDRVLFISDRLKPGKEDARLFLMPVDGGEAQPLGELTGELTVPSWSPDGRLVAVIRRDPEPEARKARKKERDDAIVVEEEPGFARLWVVDPATGSARCLTTGNREVRDYAWAPDSASIALLTTDDVGFDALMGPSDLWQVSVAGAMPRHVARLRTSGTSLVVVETDEGPVVAMRSDGHREQPSDSLWVVPLVGGEPRNLLPDLMGIVEEVIPYPGEPGRVAARVVERTRARLYGVDVVSGAMAPITPPALAESGSIIQGVTFSADGMRFAAIWTDSRTPEEVVAGEPGGDVATLTTFGESFIGRLQPVEHVTWLSDGGVEVEGLLTYPQGYEPGRRYPLVVEIHGGPSWQWEDRVMLDWHDWAQLLASHGIAVLMPNPRGSTGYGHAYQQLLQDDVGGGESRDLVTGAEAMVERGIADPERLGIAGWSWGGYLTAWTITQTDIFKAAMMGAGLANLISDHGQDDIPSANLLYFPGHPYHHMDDYWKASPIRYVSAVTTPTLILHGDADARVHPAQGMEYFRALKTLGVPVRFVRYPREGHGIKERLHQIDLMQRIVDWFDRYLQPAAGASNGRANGRVSAEE